MSQTTHRVPAGVSTGGQFAPTTRDEASVDLTRGGDRYAGSWSIDDFTPEQRHKFDSLHRHAYDWAAHRVGNLGMENSDYAEDYAAWVGRRYVALDFDDDAIGDHKDLHARWDAERAAAAAQTVAEGMDEGVWAARMSKGSILSGADIRKSDAMSFLGLKQRLAAAGVQVSEARAYGGRLGWKITSLDADRFGRQVWVGDPGGARVDRDDEDY
ncbi:hypothetical protein [Cellulosimicrobium sp. Marseille-Q4280]|uniref:hypothetical protein n=1 Tax=Cellulosimicrobium sp. Marseille-Q4280 TaxID=2937992 RepID=UPI00204246DE|nr:hypothetical protein [Cellulosimicrobium sp. Marseille-Q4280]